MKSSVSLCCMEHRGWVEKQGVPDAMWWVNLNDTYYLEGLTWAIYDGALLVGGRPELLGDRQWCTMLAGIFKHIYKGHNKTAHCPPYTLVSWDCQQRTKVLCKERRRGATWCGHNDGCRARKQRSRSSSRCHSRMPSQMGWSRYSCCSPPNTLPRRHSAGEPFSPSANTMPKLSLAVSIPAYARSSHSAGGVAQALLDDDEDWEEDFQTPHTPICHVVR